MHGLRVAQAATEADAEPVPAALGQEALMRKIFCDGCGTECVNLTVHLHGAISHTTSAGEQVGYDDLRPVELCMTCFEPIQERLHITVRPQEMDGFGSDGEIAVRPVPPPLAASELP